MRSTDLIHALAVVVIWGFNFVVVKTAVGEIPPLALAVLRFSAVALLVAPFFRPTRDQFKHILGLAVVMGPGHFGLLFMGLDGADAATAALMIQLGVPFSAILAVMVFSDRLGMVQGLGMAMAFAGAALLAGEPQGGTPLALGALLVSAFCWAWANILIKKAPDIPPMTIIGWMSLLSIPVVAGMSAMFETGQLQAIQNAGMKTWGALAYIVLASSIVAYYLWYRLIARLSVNRVVPFTLLAPMIGVAAGVLILGEAFTLYTVTGGVLTMAGVAIIQMRRAKGYPHRYQGGKTTGGKHF